MKIADRPLLLMTDPPEEVREKLESAGGELQRLWDHTRRMLHEAPSSNGDLAVLPAMLGIDPPRAAQDWVRSRWRHPLENAAEEVYQFHTWCMAGNLLRPLVFFDWLDDLKPWSRRERREAAESFLGFGLHHCYATLTSRTREADNQCFAMSLYCFVAGCIFGERRSAHPTAMFLKRYAARRLEEILGLFPRSGYGLEGSTYTSHVNTPLFCWTHALLRELEGEAQANRAFEPNGGTLLEAIRTELRITSPSGLQAPWDSYGWQRARHASPFAYLARLEREPTYLNLVKRFGLGRERETTFAWGEDDVLWSLLWWPTSCKHWDRDDLDPDMFGFCLPTVGAALDDTNHRVRLFQVWDRSAATVSSLARSQVNPNHLMLEVAGQPVLTDGSLSANGSVFTTDPELVLSTLGETGRRRMVSYIERLNGSAEHGIERHLEQLAVGLIGASNSVLVDDEMSYWPGDAREGKAIAYGRSEFISAVVGDACDYYNPRYAMHHARRLSAWNHEHRIGIVLDDLHSEQPHRYTWQAYVAGDVCLVGEDGVLVTLEDGQRVGMRFADPPALSLTPVPGFPRPDGSHRVEAKSATATHEHRFAVVIAVGEEVESVRWDAGNRLTFDCGGVTHTVSLTAAPGMLRWQTPDQTRELELARVDPEKADCPHLPDAEYDDAVTLPSMPVMASPDDAEAGNPDWLARVDACFAQLGAVAPDAELLGTYVQDADWRVAVGAAEAIGRLRLASLSPLLRKLLEREHELGPRALYDRKLKDPADHETACRIAKRWRLKASLILALGRLRDQAAIGLIERIARDGWDFYPALSLSAKALSLIATPDTRAGLEVLTHDVEINTRQRARDGLRWLEKANPS